jgi:hypothetical protein
MVISRGDRGFLYFNRFLIYFSTQSWKVIGNIFF